MPADDPPLPSRTDVSTMAASASPTGGGSADPVSAAGPPLRLEHYEILTRPDGQAFELGRGAMGITYKALDTRLQCHVAIKLINADILNAHPVARDRFLREARAAARLRHANVASVFHLGDDAAGHCFYAMEFIEGENVTERVRRTGPLPPGLAVEIALQVARALVAAERQQLIHRDLKPSNLMLTVGVGGTDADDSGAGGTHAPGSGSTMGSEGSTLVKVIDFGLAKVAAGDEDLTFGGFVGTPQYASPEQLDARVLDTRSDLYSLGCTLWYMLTGKPPFAGRSPAEVQDRQYHQVLPLADLPAARVPPPVAAVLERLLALKRDDRLQTPQEAVEALWRCRQEITIPSGALASSPAGGQTIAAASPRLSPAERRRRWVRAAMIAGFVTAVLLITAGISFYFLRPAPSSEKSVAVLPFENFSADPENAFFADGMQDDVLTSLAKIGGLKVISRSSVLPYRDAAARRGGMKEIARALGVSHLVEGSVRRAGGHVIINVKLIDAATNRQVWADRYDQPLADALSLQGKVASEIAAALSTGLSAEERARVGSKPTANADAYVLYLRAREALNRVGFKRQDYEAIARLYEQAIALDPGFALAHAGLSHTRSLIGHLFGADPAIQRAARAAADTALRLQPGLGEGHFALALCHYWIDKDIVRAQEQFAIAARALPNDPELMTYLASIQRMQGRWAESTAGFERAMAINPRSPDIPYELATNQASMNNWTAAARTAERAVALAPDEPTYKLWRADLLFHAQGDLRPLEAALAEMPAGSEKDEVVTTLRYQSAMVRRDYDAAERALDACPADVFATFDYGAPRPKSYLRALIYLARRAPGDEARARENLNAARAVCEEGVRALPLDPYRHVQLGLLYAALGWRDPALGEGWYAAQLLPEKQNAGFGPVITTRRAQIYALLGDAAGAAPLVEHLLAIPDSEMLSVADVRLRPEWDAVRADPLFVKLLASDARASLPSPGN